MSINLRTTFPTLSVLVIDDMPTQQTTLRGQLQMLDISKIDVASTAEDALRLMKSRQYAVVMCDYNLNQKTDGQQILEHARENGLVAPHTLFFMVTAENSYTQVASASECKPDAYVLKPVNVGDIEERLRTQLDRRHTLLAAHQAQARQDWPGVMAACDAVVQAKSRWTMAALQLKSQVLMQLGRHEEAASLFEKVLQIRAGTPWAMLGLAKARKAAGLIEEAKVLAYELVRSREGEKNVEAYDLVAQCLEEQGDIEGAAWTLRDAAAVLPSARRQRLLGEAAYRAGDLETAKDCFNKVLKQTKGSISATAQDTLMLAQVKVDSGEMGEAATLLEHAIPNNRHDPSFTAVAMSIKAQAHFKLGDAASGEAALARARQSTRKAKADFGTVALAKAQLMGGHEEEGLKLLSGAVAADHENPRVKQLIGNVLRDTGREHLQQQVIDGAVQGLNTKVADAKGLFRNSQIDEALAAIEAALREYPDNTGVLLQAAQMNCLALRLKKQLNATMTERVRSYLQRLDSLLPGSDRVAQMHRYFRETTAALTSAPKVAASATALG
jgi:tetratricopeptide (TPR) repeat protein